MAAALTTPTTCSKCNGDGTYRDFRVCYCCNGAGVVEGDRATIAATKAYTEARRAIREWAVDAAVAAGMPRHNACNLTYALDLLAETAPQRHQQALAAHAAHHPHLLAAIVTYAAEQGVLRYGGRLLTVPQALAQIEA